MFKSFKYLAVIFLFCVFFSEVAGATEEVNVYTSRHYDVDQAIYDEFTKKTGIKVNVISGKAPEILARLKSEGADTPADVFMTVAMVNMYDAISGNLVSPIKSAIINENIPASLRGENNEWVAFKRSVATYQKLFVARLYYNDN